MSLGALDAVPTDVLAQILRLLGPADAARSTAVCRAWRVLASDNALWAFFLRLGPDPWDLVVFAETHLAAGPADSHPWSVPRAATPPLCLCSSRRERERERERESLIIGCTRSRPRFGIAADLTSLCISFF
jgi:hypothetical protein